MLKLNRKMGKVTYVNVKARKGATIVRQNITVTEDVKIGNTKKTQKKKRLIQYVKTLDTIYVEEQIQIMGGEKPSPDPIYIHKGKLDVDENDTALIKFMDIHPDNKANGGHEFRKLDVEKEDLFEVNKFKKTSKISSTIMDAEENLARSIAVWFLGTAYIKMKINKLKKALYTRCQGDFDFVEKVEAFMADKATNQKLMVTLSLTENIIAIVDGKKIAWMDNGEIGEIIYIGSQAKDLVTDFSVWLKTDEEGRETLQLIADKLPKQ